MSITAKLNVTEAALTKFLANEYKIDSGIPVHLFTDVRSKMVGMCDNVKGCLFFDGSKQVTAWGDNDFTPITRALRSCGVKFKFI